MIIDKYYYSGTGCNTFSLKEYDYGLIHIPVFFNNIIPPYIRSGDPPKPITTAGAAVRQLTAREGMS